MEKVECVLAPTVESGVSIALPVDTWQAIHSIVSEECTLIGNRILEKLKESIDGYYEPGPEVELSEEDWKEVLFVLNSYGDFESVEAEITFALLEE